MVRTPHEAKLAGIGAGVRDKFSSAQDAFERAAPAWRLGFGGFVDRAAIARESDHGVRSALQGQAATRGENGHA